MPNRRADFFEDVDVDDLLQGRYDVSNALQQPFARNILNRYGLLYEPVVDQLRISRDERRPTWPGGKDFAVCLTHDVDKMHPRSSREILRKGYRTARQEWRETGLARAARTTVGHTHGALRAISAERDSPEHHFTKWLEAEEAVDANSTFFFAPADSRRPHRSDPPYRYEDTVTFDGEQIPVADLFEEIAERGNEIGLHATRGAVDDLETLKHQRTQLVEASGQQVASIRNHWLFYDLRQTPRIQSEAGFEYDSTLAVTGNIGFRFGTSYPFYLSDMASKTQLPLLEVPLVVQDTALFDSNYLALSDQEGFQYVVRIAERVKDVGGVLTLNWHPNTTKRGNRYEVYRRVLQRLSEMGAWIGTVAEVGREWQAR